MVNQYRSAPFTPEEIAKWEATLDEGYSYKHTAEVHGIHQVTVAKYLPGRGWTRKQITQHGALVRRYGKV